MKIIYIHKHFVKGGIERIITDKMNWLGDHDHEIILVTLSQKDIELPFELDNVRHIDLNIDFPPHDLNKIAKAISYVRINRLLKQKLKDLISNENPDIIVSLMSTELPLLSRMNIRAKKIVEYHGSNFTFDGSKGIKALKDRYFTAKLKRQISRFDKLVILNQSETKFWKKTNCIAIPNFCTFKSDINSSLDNRHAIAVGRLSEEKNQESMLRIWQKVHPIYPEWILDIYGDGPCREHLMEYAKTLNISNSIVFHGNSDRIKDEYLKSDFLLNTSYSEGFCLTNIEAIECGLPVISYLNSPSVRDVIADGQNGFIIPQNNEILFAERIKELISNEKLRHSMGQKSKEMSKIFNKEAIMMEWVNLFENLIR